MKVGNHFLILYYLFHNVLCHHDLMPTYFSCFVHVWYKPVLYFSRLNCIVLLFFFCPKHNPNLKLILVGYSQVTTYLIQAYLSDFFLFFLGVGGGTFLHILVKIADLRCGVLMRRKSWRFIWALQDRKRW